MNNIDEIAQIVKKQLVSALEETFGPLLLELAKNIKTLHDESGDQNPLMTEIVALKLQSQMIKNQLNDVSEKLGLEIPESLTEADLKTSSTQKSRIDEQQIRNIIHDELTNINTSVLNEFQNIDKILARFFKKSVADNKIILEHLKNIQSSPTGKTPVSQKVPSQTYETEPINEKTAPYVADKPIVPDSKPVQPSTFRPVSTQASFTTSGIEQDSDIERTQTAINYFNQGNINPKDAIVKIETLRDAIIIERSEEAPYRVTASKMMREIIFSLSREKSRRILTDGTTTHVIKQLEVFLDHIRGV